jgi:hypothetical protein
LSPHKFSWRLAIGKCILLGGLCRRDGIEGSYRGQISADTIPEKNLITKIYTHGINQLRGLAGLKGEYDETVLSDTLFAANWAICSEWSPETRYEEKTSAEAHYILVATTDSKHGVLPWITKYW